MRKLTLTLTAALCLAAANTVYHNVAYAYGWTNDPWNGMVSVCNAPGEQSFINTCQLGRNNTLVVWTDHRSNIWQTYYQVLDYAGRPLLQLNGKKLYEGNSYDGLQGIISDAQGGCIFVTRNNPNTGLYGQRIDSMGNRLWGDNGLPLIVWPGSYATDITSDSLGNFFVGWYVGWPDANLYAQKFNASGQRFWGDYGVPVCTQGNTQRDMRIVPDNAGGLQAIWGDGRPNNQAYHLYFQHLDTRGNPYWTVNGIPLHDMSGNLIPENFLAGVSDGQSGSIWHTLTDAIPNNFYLFRIDGAGNTIWYWTNYTYYEHQPREIIRHPDGTFWMGMYEHRTSGWGDYLYHFNMNGNQLLGTLGRDLGAVVSLTSTGVIGGRVTSNNPQTREDAQRVENSGQLIWSVPFAMSNTVQAFYINNSAPDGVDGVVYPFEDSRDSIDWQNISAQRVNADGTLGTPNKYRPVPQPTITGQEGESLTFILAQEGPVKVELFDILGRKVITRDEGYQPAGKYMVQIDKWGFPSGVYLMKLTVGDKVMVKKVVITR